MRFLIRILVVAACALVLSSAQAQPLNRVPFNSQQLFLSGANLAWMSFANDIGPGKTDFVTLGNTLLEMHDHGGNAMRWWLHTNGMSTPQFDTGGKVIGPGINAISNLRQSLDIAWQRGIGVDLCLWSFDMLRTDLDPAVLSRNESLLLDTAFTNAYIRNSLIPMVDSLKGQPGILCWEIFNEPEGMSTEFGWSGIGHVPMSVIQRFVNLCAGAIHREDSTALVTSGSWSFKALTDVPVASVVRKGPQLPSLSLAEQQAGAEQVKEHYRLPMSTDEIIQHMHRIASLQNVNYYLDSRLIAAGGDQKGTLDFYSVHYYTTIDGTADVSPFHHADSVWGLTKPIVVAEFAMQNTLGIPKQTLFDTLYKRGYAGALPWSWTDGTFSSHADMDAGMQFMWDHYRADVEVNGVARFWPSISIVSPPTDTTFADTSSVTIVTAVSDSGSRIVSVKFYADTALIGEGTTAPFSITWPHVPNGEYLLTAVATDSIGHQRTSNVVKITVGIPPMTKLEAETATRVGTGFSVKTDPLASGGSYLDMQTSIGTITWVVPRVPATGSYPISIRFKLAYDRPKTQFINAVGGQSDTVVFDETSTTTWYTKTINLNLTQGVDTIQMVLSWGWMYVDYLAVPTNLVTSISPQAAIPTTFALEQNYPNPFNPSTIIRYQVPRQGPVSVKVYDLVGRLVRTLVNNEIRVAGTYDVRFDASNLASGVYFYRLQADGQVMSKKMILVK